MKTQIKDSPPFYAYGIAHIRGIAIGFDARPRVEVEQEWLEKWARAGARVASVDLEEKKQFAKVRAADAADPVLGGDAHEELRPLERIVPTEDEIFRLSGVPGADGFGSLTLLAADVRGILEPTPHEVAMYLAALSGRPAEPPPGVRVLGVGFPVPGSVVVGKGKGKRKSGKRGR